MALLRREYFLLVALFFAAITAFLVFAITSSAQTEMQATPAQEPDTGQYVLQAQVPLVILDVGVTDKKGHPVHGLKRSDFTVLEKGQVMTVQSFEEHRADQTPAPLPPPSQKPLPPNVFTNITNLPPNNGPLNVLLLDALDTAVGDQLYVRNQMVEYIKKLPAGTRLAIFGLSTHLYMLQSFTSDPAVLKAVLNSKKALPSLSVLLGPSPALMEANMDSFMSDPSGGPDVLRMQYALGAMNDLAHYLAAFPGRKNLIWFSGSFPFNLTPNGDMDDTFQGLEAFQDDARATNNLLSQSQVAVYPVDGRGLFSSPALGADNRGTTTQSPLAQTNSNKLFFEQTTGEHQAMDLMAQQSGGKAFYDTNGLKDAVQEAVAQGSNYYTLTYAPTNRKWDSGYRSIHVKVDQPEVDLFYRRGYFADDPNAPPVHGQEEKVLPMNVMQRVMQRGGPDSTQILFKVKIVPAAGMENTLPPLDKANPKGMKPPYRHYTVWYAPYLKNISFGITSAGKYHGTFEFVTNLYAPDGELMNSTSNVVNTNLPVGSYKALMQRGLNLNQEIAAPAKGEYFLRMAVHDLTNDHVGALEVPLAAVQPMPAPALPAAARK